MIVDVCPCDVHFNDWVAKQKLKNKTIYHFGSGTHHIVGIKQAQQKNRTFCITASKEEYEAYVDLVTGNSAVARNYVCYFGDIYLTNPALLPELDVVTMFHLCEFFFPNTASKEYGGLDRRQAARPVHRQDQEGGYIVFYKGSIGFEKAKPIIAKWEKKGAVKRVGEFKTLLVYKKK